MSNITGDEWSFCYGEGQQLLEENQLKKMSNGSTSQHQFSKKKRNLPGNPDPSAEVIALSPTSLMATNRFVCEICNKGFQREQNLQLHRRGHNLPWKLTPKSATDDQLRKRVYTCPVRTCVHHSPSRALGDLTGIKKHYSRKHGEKRWKCEKCSKKYAVQSDWKAHQKTCGTRDYTCHCGTIFSRKDNLITHRAFCHVRAGVNHGLMSPMGLNLQAQFSHELISTSLGLHEFNKPTKSNPQEFGMFSGPFLGSPPLLSTGFKLNSNSSPYSDNNQQGFANLGWAQMSDTDLLQKSAQIGSTSSSSNGTNSPVMQRTDPISGPGPTSNANSLDCYQAHNEQSSRFLKKGPQEMSRLFAAGGSSTITNDMVAYGDSAARLLKSSMGLQDESDQSSMRCELGRNNNNNNNMIERNQARLGGRTEMTTVDFLGVNGGSRTQNLNHRLYQYGDSAAEKPLYKSF